MPSPLSRAFQRGIDLHEHLEDAAAAGRRRCRCRCRALGSRAVLRSSCSSDEPDATALVGELAGVVQQVADHLARPSGSAFTYIGCGGRTRQLVAHASAAAGGRLRRRDARTDASSIRLLRSSILPRLMRLTSSRSSTSRTIWSTCRSIISGAYGATSPSPLRQPQDLRRVADRGQRVAQLVGEHRQEFVLAAVGLRQLGGELQQLVSLAARAP